MAWHRAAIFAALLLFGTVSSAMAQDVTLTSRDGAVEITGTLLGFDGEFYRVDTQFGELTVDGSGVLCDGPGCPNLSDFVAEITFSGASTMAEVLLPALIEGFAMRNGYQALREPTDNTHFTYLLQDSKYGKAIARFQFRVTNTDEGFADLLANEADIVMALREIRPDERQRARDAGMGDMTGHSRSRVLSLDAMVPVVARKNPVDRVSVAQLAQVFSGQITNWSELGGPDAPITMHMPALGSGLSQAAEDTLLYSSDLRPADDIVRHDRSSSVVAAVQKDPFGIGLASFAEAGGARVLMLSGQCDFSLVADRRSIKTEDYPLTSPMFLYMPARRLPKLARDFLTYTRSPGAQIVIRRAGFVDQTPEQITIGAQGDRFANAIQAAGPEVPLEELQRMINFLKPMSRLTMSFRFETGSSRPDAQSRTNVSLLARAIEAGEYDGRRLVFVGFSDGEGAASGNRRIALARAEAVRNAVLQTAEAAGRGKVDIRTQAFGEALPMACDENEWGRKVNRRVEVWIK